MATAAFEPCAFDFDCTGPGQLCYVNVSWGPTSEGFCDCNHWYGWEGPDCASFSATTRLLGLSLVLQIVVGMVFAAAGFRDLARMFSAFQGNIRLNAALVTLLSVTLSLSCHVLWRILYYNSAKSPAGFNQRVSDDADAEKLVKHAISVRPFIFFCVVTLVIATATSSIMWIEIVRSSKKMVAARGVVTHFRRAIIVFEIVFAISFGILAALGKWHLSVIVVLPFLLTILIANLVGRNRMVRLLGAALTMHSGSSASKESHSHGLEPAPASASVVSRSRGQETSALQDSPAEAVSVAQAALALFVKALQRLWARFLALFAEPPAESMADRTRNTIALIKWTSLHICIGIFGILLSGTVYFLFNSVLHPAGWREYSPDGSFSWITLVNDLLPISILYILVTVLLYSHRNTNNLIRRQKGVAEPVASSSDFRHTGEGTKTETFSTANGRRTLQTTSFVGTPSCNDIEV